MNASKVLSVVIPAYNEERFIGTLLERINAVNLAPLGVRAEITLPPDNVGRLLVVGGAVQPLGDEDVVFVEREPGSFEVRPVKVGRRTVDLVEITEGVSVGERLAVEGAFLLRGEASKQ